VGQQPPAALGQGEHDPESRCPKGILSSRSDRGLTVDSPAAAANEAAFDPIFGAFSFDDPEG
jgi:hypothetical protein